MQFQIKQRVFSLADTFDITDAQCSPAYQARGEAFSFGNRLALLDGQGVEVARIQQKVLSLSSEYDISQGGATALVFKQDGWHPFHPQYAVDGPAGSYQMQGDWLGREYSISADERQVAQISQRFSWVTSTYGVEVADGADAPLLLCLAIVVDEVAHAGDGD